MAGVENPTGAPEVDGNLDDLVRPGEQRRGGLEAVAVFHADDAVEDIDLAFVALGADIEQFRREIGVGRIGRDVERDRDAARGLERRFERRGGEEEQVRAAFADAALVKGPEGDEQVRPAEGRERVRGVERERQRCFGLRWGGGEAAVGVQVERRLRGLEWRPRIGRAPFVAGRAGARIVAHRVVVDLRPVVQRMRVALEIAGEERLAQFADLQVEAVSIVVIFGVLVVGAVAGPFHDEVVLAARAFAAVLLAREEGVDRALVEDVVPAADEQAGRGDVARLRHDVVEGPELVVGRVGLVYRDQVRLLDRLEPALDEALAEHAAVVHHVVVHARRPDFEELGAQVRRGGREQHLRDGQGRAALRADHAVAPRLRLDPGDGVRAVGEAGPPAVRVEDIGLALALAHAAHVLDDHGVAVVQRFFDIAAAAPVSAAHEDDRPGAFARRLVDVRGQFRAVAHRQHQELGRVRRTRGGNGGQEKNRQQSVGDSDKAVFAAHHETLSSGYSRGTRIATARLRA